MPDQNRLKAQALVLKARKIVLQENKDLTARRQEWEDLIREAIELDDNTAQSLASDALRQEGNYADQVKKILVLVKQLFGLVQNDKRSGDERRERQTPVATERRREQRRKFDEIAAILVRIKAKLKVADKAFANYNTAKTRFLNGVDGDQWNGDLIKDVEADDPQWGQVDKVLKQLFKIEGIGA